MYSTLFTTTLIFALAALGVQADFNVNTVSLTQCQPATLTWDQTTGPYDVVVVASAQPCGDPLVDFGYLDSNTFQWPQVNITAGTQVLISIVDQNDDEGWSGVITVGASGDGSCLTSQDGTPAPPPPPPPASTPKASPPSPPTTTTDDPSSPTLLGAANNGILNGASTLHFSGAAIAATVLGALAVLL